MLHRFLHRFLSLLVSAAITLLGVAVAWTPFIVTRRDLALLNVLWQFCSGSFICVFGVSMTWQYVRGAKLEQGFIIRWLRAMPRVVSPAHAFAALCGLALASLLVGEAAARPQDALAGRDLLLFLLTLHVHIAWHELGHLWATRACRYRVRRVVVGGLAATPSGVRWRLLPNREWRFFLGGAVVFSAEQNRRTWSRDVMCYSAGPLATLVSIGAIVLAQWLCRDMPRVEQLLAQNLVLAIIILVFNLLPLRQFRTDGYELLELMLLRATRGPRL